MKNDIDWLKEQILILQEKYTTKRDISGPGNRRYYNGMLSSISLILDFINELDEPEVLSQKWIEGKTFVVTDSDGDDYAVVAHSSLQNLLVPKQELPVIPKYVAEYVDLVKIDIPLMKILEVANRRNELPEWKKEYDWISANDETFARAWLDGYTVAEEQKYYVDLDTAAYVAKWNGDDQVDIYTDDIFGSDEFEFFLTEQEIKNYDERFWPFAEPAEQWQ